MAKRRGRRSKARRKQILEQDAGKIAKHFLSYPLREPVDPRFDPYYRRILNGDLFAVWDYYGTGALEGSCYELIGRLVPLQYFAAAEQIISDVQLCGDEFDTARGGELMPPDWLLYEHYYELLLPLCRLARRFIREKYKAVASVKLQEIQEQISKDHRPHSRAQNVKIPSLDTKELKAFAEEIASVPPDKLWNEYVDKFFLSDKRDEKARSQDIEEFKAWAEQAHFQRREPGPYGLMENYSRHHLIPKRFFFALSKRSRHPDDRTERDQRYKNQTWRWTPAAIARLYASAVSGRPPRTVVHL
jgi:hypothetical protein